MMNFLKNIRAWQWILAGSVVALSVATWFFLYTEQLTLIYNDAKSYLNISRLVVDSQQPGLAQIGTVWLPLIHVIKLPFIWIDWAWQSGFAGSIISMVSYVFTVIGMYAVVAKLTANRLAAIAAGIVTALNANLLYLQSTPLSEPLYLVFLVWSTFFLITYLKTSQTKYLLPLALMVALQVMTRYDGWLVAATIAIIIAMHELWVQRYGWQKAFGQWLVYAAPVAFACLLWFGWNAVIFGDPLYFATGPSSAQAQQKLIDSQSGLITKGDLGASLTGYWYAVVGNVGWLVLGLATLGWLLYIATTKYKTWKLPIAAFAVLASIFAFNVIALFLGFSTINVPQLGWEAVSGQLALFNVRYGILLLPLAAVGIGLLVARWRYAIVAAIAVVVLQGVIMLRQTPIIVQDGKAGASAFVQHDLAKTLKQNIKSDDDVLLSMSFFKPVAFESNMSLKHFVHEGVRDRWQPALDNPSNASIEWIVMSNNDVGDAIYAHMRQHPKLLENYDLVYRDAYASLYGIKSANN